jgi:hypothetical protein
VWKFHQCDVAGGQFDLHFAALKSGQRLLNRPGRNMAQVATWTSRDGQGFNLGAVPDHLGRRCPVSSLRVAYGLPHRLVALSPVMAAATYSA